MKKLLLLLFVISITSCNTKKEVYYAIISGTISNSSSDKITVRNQYNSAIKKEIALDKNGFFTDTIQVEKASFFSFYEDRNFIELFLSKGNNIILNYDAKDLDTTLKITGNGSLENSYLLAKKKTSKDAKELYSLNEKEFLTAVDDIKTKQQDLLFNTNGLSKNFTENETENIKYEALSAKANFETYHRFYAKDKLFKASNALKNSLKGVSIENESDFQFSSNYRNFVTKSLGNQAEIIFEKDSIQYDLAYLSVLSTLKSQIIKNKLAYDEAKYGITYTEDLEAFYSSFLSISADEENNKNITESYIKIKALAKGSISPEFTNYENNAGGTTSLKDLKGKFVYIDVWATWCGPCVREIPSLKKVEKKYHGKNIAFVSISIDKKKDHEKWKKMIVDKELEGIQLFADNNWESKFVADYLIKGIPRFILIDTEGKIVNSNALRPSGDKLISLFNELKI